MIDSISKFLSSNNLLYVAFIIEVFGFFFAGYIFAYNEIISSVILLFSIIWAFVVGNGIKFKVLEQK